MNTFSVKIFGLVLVFLLPVLCFGQGTLTATFDGPPVQPPGSAFNVQSYSESGMYFLPLAGSDGFGRVWSNAPSALPNDGTPYLDASAGDSLKFGFRNGASFSVSAVDLAGYSTVVPNFSVEFIGTLENGGTVSTTFSGSGIDFSTFHFGPEWTGLTSVEIPNDAWSMDNLSVIVPEPGNAEMFALGAVVISLRRSRRK